MLTVTPSLLVLSTPDKTAKGKYISEKLQRSAIMFIKVIVQGVVALGGHFATFCQELDFYEAFFFNINFQKTNKI